MCRANGATSVRVGGKAGTVANGDRYSRYGKAGTVANGDRYSRYGKAGTVANGDRYSRYGKAGTVPTGTGAAGMVKLVRWPTGTGTANEYIAGTAPRGWNSKLECYGLTGGGCNMEGDGLRAEGEFLVLFGLFR